MADFKKIVEDIKKAALSAVEASKPVNITFGKVVSENPVRITVEQKMTLESAQLIFTQSIPKQALKINDSIVLLRMQGGQKYLIIDRGVDEFDTGSQ